MNRFSGRWVDNLMQKSHQKLQLKLLEKLFVTGIPFNIPHKFKFIELSDNRTILKLPYIRCNKNHLGGIHACATATLGEFPAGLGLVKHFSSSKYRLIMEELHVKYIKQAKEELIGIVEISDEQLALLKKELNETGITQAQIVTNIYNKGQEVIAEVHTKWQIKEWEKVSYKTI